MTEQPWDPAAELRRERAETPREAPPRMPSREAVRKLVSLDGAHLVVRNSEIKDGADGIPAGVEVEETSATLVVSADFLLGKQPRPRTEEDDQT